MRNGDSVALYHECRLQVKRDAACQQMPLEPATDVQLIAYGAIKIPGVGPPVKNVTEIKGVYVNKGTKPTGSTWIRNPIPACYGPGPPSLTRR